MTHANLPISFWGDALLTATYIINRVPSKSIIATAYELWYGKKPSLDHLRPWDSADYVYNQTIAIGNFEEGWRVQISAANEVGFGPSSSTISHPCSRSTQTRREKQEKLQ